MNAHDRRDEEEPRVIRRIVVALDASPDSLAALQASAELASVFPAELVGLYVEDVNVLRLAGWTHATEIDLLSARSRRISTRDLERQLRIQAARARQTLERLAEQRAVEWTFRTARGRVSAELLGAGADLITLGVRGHGQGRGPGSTVQRLLEAARSPVLLTRRGIALGGTVHVVDDGTAASERALEVAAGLARRRGLPLAVLRITPRERVIAAEREAAAGEARPEAIAETREPPSESRLVTGKLLSADAEAILRTLHHERAGLLVLPRSATPAHLRLFLRRAHCPVLVVD